MTESPAVRVLSTMNEDGTRRWLRPRVSQGRFLQRRRVVAYALIALFVALPRIRIHGRPALLIDLGARELSAFGAVFRPSDGTALMLFGLTIVLAVFLITALFGRVWCGWACPQTVYLEFVFRPLERRFLGTGAKRDALPRFHVRRIALVIVYAALAFGLANVFLAYFVGTDRLERWVFEAPGDHRGGFLLVVGVSALMFFDFAYFREQTCIVACPYGRLQTVLLDPQSLIVAYDATRGEPRAQPKKRLPVLEQRGACVDCGACVTTCPTGIDIREGLQMECIGCAQCADACDTVMDKLQQPRHLIGYTSQRELERKPRQLLRLRTLVYPALLAVIGVAFAWSVGTRPTTEVTVLRLSGPAFVELAGGRVAAQAQLRIENATDVVRHYAVTLVDAPDAKLVAIQPTWQAGPRHAITVPLAFELAATTFAGGTRVVHVRVDDAAGFSRVVPITLLGPERGAP